MRKTQVSVVDSCIAGDDIGVKFSGDSEDYLRFTSGTIYAAHGNAIAYYPNNKATDFIDADSFLSPGTKLNLVDEYGQPIYGTASKVTVCSKPDSAYPNGYSWYTGKNVTPKIFVDAKDGTTISKANYDIIYPGNHKLPGNYEATIKFKNAYAGQPSLTLKFTIAVKDSPILSLKGIDNGFKIKLKKLSKNYVTGYQIKYSTSKNFQKKKTVIIKLGNSKKKIQTTINNLNDNTKYYVKTRTYKKIKIKANGKTKTKTYYSPWWDGPVKVKTK